MAIHNAFNSLQGAKQRADDEIRSMQSALQQRDAETAGLKEALRQLNSQHESERGQSREEYLRAFQKMKDENW